MITWAAKPNDSVSRVYGGTLIGSMQYRYNGNQLQSIRDVSIDISKNGTPFSGLSVRFSGT